MLAMFTLYLQNPDQGFGWTEAAATRIYANYLMFVYASPAIGGLIADLGLGYRRSVLIGGLIFMVGYALLAVHSEWVVYLALACLVIGNGFFKPNVSAMVGHLYPEGSTLKDRAYNIFYMGINIGALLAPLSAGFMVKNYGFDRAFLVVSGGMVVSVAILVAFRRHVEGIRLAPVGTGLPTQTSGRVVEAIFTDPKVGVTEDLPPGTPDPWAGSVPPTSTPPASPTLPAPPARSPAAIDAVPDWQRITALVTVFVIVIVFWMVFHQNGSTLTYWAKDNTDWAAVGLDPERDKDVLGIISNAINPFWVIALTFPVVLFWHALSTKGWEPATPTKMGFGMALLGLSFFLLAAAPVSAKRVLILSIATTSAYRSSGWWPPTSWRPWAS